MARFPLDPPPGLWRDNTTFSAEARWYAADKVRFWRGRPEVIGGWEALSLTALTGVCRTVLSWTNQTSTLNVAFGTNSNLQLFYGGEMFTITPTLNMPPVILKSNKLTATVGSGVISANMPGHGLTTGDTVIVSGATTVGNLVPNGTYTVTVIDLDNFTYTFAGVATTTTLGAAPLSVVLGTKTVTVTHTAHGLTDGATVVISGAAAVGGITPNGTFVIDALDANSYSYQFTTAATATATGGGGAVAEFAKIAGGGAVKIAPQNAFVAGQVDGSGSAGYSTGAYSTGPYSVASTQDYFPMTWSLANYGESLMANPRGRTIYWWQNDTAVVAQPLLNAPAKVTFMLVTPERQVLAFGCNEELSGEFNALCIRGSDIENPEDWTTRTSNNAFEYVVEGGGRLVGARLVGSSIFVWTSEALYQATFLGDPSQTYRFDLLGKNCGLLGPNAAMVFGQTAYWVGADLQFRSCSLGGAPSTLSSPLQNEFAENLALSQQDKVVAASVNQFGEMWLFYPDSRDGYENSRYLLYNVLEPAWSQGLMIRTAFTDATSQPYPIGVDYSGYSYYHERGNSANGSPLSWSLESADYYLGEGDKTLQIESMWPDFKGQQGVVCFSITGRLYPQATERTVGPYALGVGQSKKDFRISARVVKVTFCGNTSPAFVRFGKPEFDAYERGMR